MLRLRSNWSVTRVVPIELDEVISLTPAIVPRRRSSGVATLVAIVSGLPPGVAALARTPGKRRRGGGVGTLVAIVSGLAPGMLALTEITGKSTCGSGDTGRAKKPAIPASA